MPPVRCTPRNRASANRSGCWKRSWGSISSCATASVSSPSPARAVLDIAQRVLRDTENLKQVGQEFRTQDTGSLRIAPTHTQARYALPHVVKAFTQAYPGVK